MIRRRTRSATRRAIQYEQNLRAPVHRLPNELLAEIFNHGRYQWPKLHLARRFLATIVGVCSLWRDVAIDSSKLWTMIIYFPMDNTAGREARAFDMLVEYLQRSRQSPIDLSIDFGPHRPESDMDILKLIDLVRLNIDRCRYLSVSANGPQQAEAMFPLSGELRSLRTLQADVSDCSYPVVLFAPSTTTRLNSLDINGNIVIEDNTLAWEYLSDLSIICTGDNKLFLRLMHRCSNLVSLRLVWRSPMMDNIPPIELPFLAVLSIYSYHPLPSSFISAPQLLHLTAAIHTYRDPPIFPSLRTLDITSNINSSERHLRFLRLLPNVQGIEIYPDEGHILEYHLREPDKTTMLHPKLDVVLVKPGTMDWKTRMILLTMLHARPNLRLKVHRGIAGDLQAEFPGQVEAYENLVDENLEGRCFERCYRYRKEQTEEHE